MKSKAGILGVLCIIAIVCVAFAITRKPSTTEPSVLASQNPGQMVTKSSPRLAAGEAEVPTRDQILQMSAADWETRFSKSHLDLKDEYKQEVLLLAGELQDSINEGLDPNGEEAGAYAQVISILLNEN